MILSRIIRIPVLHSLQKSKLHYNFTPHPHETPPTSQEWFNIVMSISNCSIIISILWGFESYKEKTKTIEKTNARIDQILIAYRLLERKCTKRV